MVKGQGSYLWDNQGKQYLDFVQGWAVNALGHSSPELRDAIAKQAELLVTPSPAFHNAPQLKLAARLAELTGLDQAHFSSSGAEANEVAVKLARKWGKSARNGAYEIITTHDSFHGRTLAMMAASGKSGWDNLFPPVVTGFRKVPFGDVAAVAQAITTRTAAIMVEPIQGEAGVVVPQRGYLKALRKLADDSGILLILDEIQTGIARTGTLFAYQHERILPDILTLGKGLGAGFPISATLAAHKVCCFDYGDQGGTFNGNPLGASAANSVLDVVCHADFLASVSRVGQRLEQALNALAVRMNFKQVRGKGLLWAVDLGSDIAVTVRDACLQRGLIVNAARPAILRFMPSLRVTVAEVNEAIDLLEASLSSVLTAA
jgi:acetylornithine/N-succinyldiaminopimelate aminotransferase